MATSSILNYLETSATSISGGTAQIGKTPSNRVTQETFLCETAITVGEVVSIDAAKMATDASGGLSAVTVLVADYNSVPVNRCVVGIAAETVTGTATAPAPIKVILRGPATSVVVQGAVIVGESLTLDSAGNAGALMAVTAAAVTPVVAYALTAAAGPGAGTVTAYVLGIAS